MTTMNIAVILTAILSSIGCTLNLTIILFNLPHLKELSPGSFLIVFLCVADLLHASNYFAFAVTELVRPDATYSPAFCKIQAVMITIGAVASINQVTGLTAFRFLVIMHDAIIKKTYAILFTAISFTISAIVVFIPFLMKSEDRSFGLHPTHLTCTIVWYSHDPATRIVTAVCVIVLAIPISFIGYAYFSIYRRVSRSINTLKETVTSRHPHNSESTSTATALENGRTVVLHEDEARKSKLLVQSIAVVLVMLLGWGPYFILGLWELVASVPVPLKYEYAAEIMVQMNAAINPVVIFIFDNEIRANLIYCLRRKQRS